LSRAFRRPLTRGSRHVDSLPAHARQAWAFFVTKIRRLASNFPIANRLARVV